MLSHNILILRRDVYLVSSFIWYHYYILSIYCQQNELIISTNQGFLIFD